MRKPFLGANWKMKTDWQQAHDLAEAIDEGVNTAHCEVVLFPSFIHLPLVQYLVIEGDCQVGAQNVCDQADGAYTGEIAAYMLKEFDCAYVLVGHSERRHIYQESTTMVANQYQKALDQAIDPILCVGETLQQRQNQQIESVLTQQIKPVIEQSGIDSFEDGVIAYEPVWAIGTGEVATSEAINEAHELIRQYLRSYSSTIADSVRIIYGGSVKPDNAASIFELSEVDGGLIGGASLESDSLLKLYNQLA